MKKYVINAIYVEGYERIALIERIDNGEKFTVHFLEYDEYLDSGGESTKRKVGDVLEGDISIDLVSISRNMDKEIMHQQTIEKSSHIEAIVEVFQVIDDYSIYAFSSISNDKILVEFEDMVNYCENDIVFIEGSLEMNEIEN